MEKNYRIFLYKPGAAGFTLQDSSAYFLGELLVDNLAVNIKLQDISTITFTVPRIISNEANTRIDEVLDGYVVELWYGRTEGVVDVDYFRYRFTIYNTPVNFSDDKIIHSYTGYSLEALSELKQIVSWPGVEISDFYRKIVYNNTAGAGSRFRELLDNGINFSEYSIQTNTSNQKKYISLLPSRNNVKDIDIFIYEVRQALDNSGEVSSEGQSSLIPLNGAAGILDDGTGVNSEQFKQGYYYLKIVNGLVTNIYIALPDNYENYDGVSTSSKLFFYKYYDNPISRRYAIGLVTNEEEFQNTYINVSHFQEEFFRASVAFTNNSDIIRKTFSLRRAKIGSKIEADVLPPGTTIIEEVAGGSRFKLSNNATATKSSIAKISYINEIQGEGFTFNYNVQKIYSKNGLTLKQLLLGKERTDDPTIEEDGVLFNTGFTIGVIHPDILEKFRSNLEFNNVTRYQAIKTLAETFDSIAVYDTVNNTVSFYPENEYGVDNDLTIRYGAYLKSLNKEIDASKIITNVIGLGKDNLTISLINPTGLNYWEDYSYYLDSYYISDLSQITTISEDPDFGITFNYSNTSVYQSKWLPVTTAEQLGKWQFTRDWFHSILTGEYNPVGFSSTITQFYNFYELRLEAIRLLVKKETEYYSALSRETKFEAFKNYYKKLRDKETVGSQAYNDFNAKFVEYNNKLQEAIEENKDFFEDVIIVSRKNIYDVNVSTSFANKMVLLQEFLNKDLRGIDSDLLRPFKREAVVNDSNVDDEKELLEIVKKHCDENKEPKVTITIDVADILAAEESKDDWNKVKVGDKINIYLDELNVDVVAQLREINVDFEQNSLSFVISTVRNYNKGFGNFVLKTIRNLYDSNNNNVAYEVDGNRYSRETSDNVNNVLNNGLNTSETPVNSGVVDDNGNSSTVTDGNGTSSYSIGEIDEVTETITSFVSPNQEGVVIRDGSVLAYHNYANATPTPYISEVELSADTGFTIRKITNGQVDKQVYIDTNGNAVFAGQLQVGTGQPQTIDEIFNNIGDQIDAGTTVYRAASQQDFDDALETANINDILLITGSFPELTAPYTYTKDDIYKFNGSTFVIDLELKNKTTGTVGGWTIDSSNIKSNNGNVVLNSDSAGTGAYPHISIAQSTQGYNQQGIFLGIAPISSVNKPVLSLVGQNGQDYLRWNGSALELSSDGTFRGTASGNITGTVTGTINASGSLTGTINNSGNGTITGSIVIGDPASSKITLMSSTTAAGTKIYSDTGVFETSGFYMDASGRFSLGNKLSWNGSALSVDGDIGGTIGTITVGNIVISSTGITATSSGVETFRLTNLGALTLKGVIDAQAGGQIGGFSIGQSTLLAGSGGTRVGISTGATTGNIAFYAGSDTPTLAPFRVTNQGILNATSGEISGWTLAPTSDPFRIRSEVTAVDTDGDFIQDAWFRTILGNSYIGMFQTDSSGVVPTTRNLYGIGPNGFGFWNGTFASPFTTGTARKILFQRTGIYHNDSAFDFTMTSDTSNIIIGTTGTSKDLTMSATRNAGLFTQSGTITLRAGTVTPSQNIHLVVNNTGGSTTGRVRWSINGGNQFFNAQNGIGDVWSSEIVKKEIESININEVEDFINKVEIKKFKYKENDKYGISFIIEDEIEKNIPFKNILFKRDESVTYTSLEAIPEYLKPYINTDNFIFNQENGEYMFRPLSYDLPVLLSLNTAVIKNHNNKIKELEEENKKLKDEIALIKAKIGL